MLKIYIVRHGQDQDNAKGILNGWRDTPLTDTGISQAQQLARKIKGTGLEFEAAYSSPLQRAFKTAKIITDYLGLEPPIKLNELIERDFGIMTGQHAHDIEKMCAPEIVKTATITYFLSPEGSETFPQLLERAEKLLGFIRGKHQDGNILLVTHGDFGKMIWTAYYGLDWFKALEMFHFGNSDMLLLAEDCQPERSHIFKIEQHNN